MRRRIIHILLGFGFGVAAQNLFAPHHGVDQWITAVLSLAGSAMGEVFAEAFVSGAGLQRAGLALSVIGALGMLLVYGIVIY